MKWLRRRVGYLTSDPRRTAAATRNELEWFLRDQGVAVPRSATLEDLRRAVGEKLGFDAGPFVAQAGRARFGAPADTRLAARRARHELQSLLRAVRGELSVVARSGFVSLRSLRAGNDERRTVSETYDLFQQGRSHMRRGAAQATVALEKAKRREPSSRSIREALGIAYFRLGRFAEAEAEFRVLVELAPSDEFAHYGLARSLVNQGKQDEAKPHIKLARSLRPRLTGDDALT